MCSLQYLKLSVSITLYSNAWINGGELTKKMCFVNGINLKFNEKSK